MLRDWKEGMGSDGLRGGEGWGAQKRWKYWET